MRQARLQRLSKTLSRAGVASRRSCEKIVQSGRVRVNGRIVIEPQSLVSFGEDKLEVDGTSLSPFESKAYYLFHKPKGYVCSAKRIGKEKLVLDLFEGEQKRLFTVGRLDKNTEGLLLVTNDGDFAQRVIHPSSGIKKEYVAKTDTEISAEHLRTLARGTRIDGDWVRPVRVSKVRKGTVKMVLSEGKRHEVRHLLAYAGLEVRSLVRTRIGALSLRTLPIGSWRPLTAKEYALFCSNSDSVFCDV